MKLLLIELLKRLSTDIMKLQEPYSSSGDFIELICISNILSSILSRKFKGRIIGRKFMLELKNNLKKKELFYKKDLKLRRKLEKLRKKILRSSS
jgi:hypothetical protein